MVLARRGNVAKRRGTVVVWVAICLVVLLGFVAVVLDSGVLFDVRRQVQGAADAAALAAATDLYENYTDQQGLDANGTAKKSAETTAAGNGFGGGQVTVNIPPKAGPFLGKAGYVEVIIAYQQKRYFSQLWSSTDVPVVARTVARGMAGPLSTGGLISLNPHLNQAFQLGSKGNARVENGGSIIVNSDHASAAYLGSTGNAIANDILIVGGYQSGSTGHFVGNIKTSAAPYADPLARFPVPDPNSLPVQSQSRLQVSKKTTLQPGYYKGGLTIGGGNVDLAPGIYYIDGGGLTLSGGGNVTGNGVFIYNAGKSGDDRININSSGDISLSPMTTGKFAGVTLFQQRDSPAVIELGSSGKLNSLTGSIYAPGARIHLGSSGTMKATQIIGDTIEIGSNGDIVVDLSGPLPRLRTRQLVE